MNYQIIDGKIITSKYFISLVSLIEKAETNKELKQKLEQEFEKIVLQGKCTFMYVYCDRKENRLRGRVGSSAGFRTGTQFTKLIPSNKRATDRSENRTALRYWDFGRGGWRAYRKDCFIVASSFYNDEQQKWYETPEEAGFNSDWKEISKLNDKYKKGNRKDTKAEIEKRKLVAKKEKEKRERQIKETKNKIHKSFFIENGKIFLK